MKRFAAALVLVACAIGVLVGCLQRVVSTDRGTLKMLVSRGRSIAAQALGSKSVNLSGSLDLTGISKWKFIADPSAGSSGPKYSKIGDSAKSGEMNSAVISLNSTQIELSYGEWDISLIGYADEAMQSSVASLSTTVVVSANAVIGDGISFENGILTCIVEPQSEEAPRFDASVSLAAISLLYNGEAADSDIWTAKFMMSADGTGEEVSGSRTLEVGTDFIFYLCVFCNGEIYGEGMRIVISAPVKGIVYKVNSGSSYDILNRTFTLTESTNLIDVPDAPEDVEVPDVTGFILVNESIETSDDMEYDVKEYAGNILNQYFYTYYKFYYSGDKLKKVVKYDHTSCCSSYPYTAFEEHGDCKDRFKTVMAFHDNGKISDRWWLDDPGWGASEDLYYCRLYHKRYDATGRIVMLEITMYDSSRYNEGVKYVFLYDDENATNSYVLNRSKMDVNNSTTELGLRYGYEVWADLRLRGYYGGSPVRIELDESGPVRIEYFELGYARYYYCKANNGFWYTYNDGYRNSDIIPLVYKDTNGNVLYSHPRNSADDRGISVPAYFIVEDDFTGTVDWNSPIELEDSAEQSNWYDFTIATVSGDQITGNIVKIDDGEGNCSITFGKRNANGSYSIIQPSDSDLHSYCERCNRYFRDLLPEEQQAVFEAFEFAVDTEGNIAGKVYRNEIVTGTVDPDTNIFTATSREGYSISGKCSWYDGAIGSVYGVGGVEADDKIIRFDGGWLVNGRTVMQNDDGSVSIAPRVYSVYLKTVETQESILERMSQLFGYDGWLDWSTEF